LAVACVVTSRCFGCKYTDCVVVCPTEAFREGEQMLYIDPIECIDCGACIPECPVEAIYAQEDVPEDQQAFIALNAEMAAQCPAIVEKKTPLVER
jgi:ferredoxin